MNVVTMSRRQSKSAQGGNRQSKLNVTVDNLVKHPSKEVGKWIEIPGSHWGATGFKGLQLWKAQVTRYDPDKKWSSKRTPQGAIWYELKKVVTDKGDADSDEIVAGQEIEINLVQYSRYKWAQDGTPPLHMHMARRGRVM